MPKAEDLFPTPLLPTVEQWAQWLEHPATEWVLSHLQKKSYRPLASSDDQWKFTTEALKAQGVNDALGEIQNSIDVAMAREKGKH
jgi:hypothetical protein